MPPTRSRAGERGAEVREEAVAGRSGVYSVAVRSAEGENIAVFPGLSSAVGGAMLPGN